MRDCLYKYSFLKSLRTSFLILVAPLSGSCTALLIISSVADWTIILACWAGCVWAPMSLTTSQLVAISSPFSSFSSSSAFPLPSQILAGQKIPFTSLQLQPYHKVLRSLLCPIFVNRCCSLTMSSPGFSFPDFRWLTNR